MNDSVGGQQAPIDRDGLATRTDPRILAAFERASRTAGATITLLGVVCVVGWIAGLRGLTSLSPTLPSMRFNSAVGLALAGVSIVSLNFVGRPKFAGSGRAAAVGVALLGLATLGEDVSGRSLGIDNPLGFTHAGVIPGRIAATTAVCFIVLATSIVALDRRHMVLGQLAAVLVVVDGLLVVTGYAFGVPTLYTVGAYSTMALPTALAFVVAGLAVLLARADEGLVALVTENTAGGVTVRRMLAPVLLGPALVGGLLDWAARSGLLTSAFRLALFTVAMIVLMTTLVWITGSTLRHLDLQRAGAEDALDRVSQALTERNEALDLLREAATGLRSSEERFRASVEHLYEALSIFTAIRDDNGSIVDFRWEFANSAACSVTGYSQADLVGKTLMEVLPDHGPSGMFEVYRNLVATGESYIEPCLWYEDIWADGVRSWRGFDVRATKLSDGFVVVTREVTEQREQEARLARQRLDLERSYREIKLLNSLADMLQSCVTAGEAYEVVAQSCAALFSGYSGAISVMHPSRDVLDVESTWGDPVATASFSPADCWALRRGRAYVSEAAGPRCAHLGGSALLRCLCVPMVGQGDTLGVLHVMSAAEDDDRASGDFERGPTRQLASTVAGQLAMAFANLRLRDSLREMSIRDPLTGLFNRRYMEETLDRELSRAARDTTEVGIVMIDVDHFKAVNDTYGHEAGDAVLEAIGEVLTRHSRTADIACRMGGEEFVMIFPGCAVDDARQRAEELRRRVAGLRVPFRQVELSGPTISCGVAAFPGHGDGREDLIHAADGALYTAKKAGRNQIAVAELERSNRQGSLLAAGCEADVAATPAALAKGG